MFLYAQFMNNLHKGPRSGKHATFIAAVSSWRQTDSNSASGICAGNNRENSDILKMGFRSRWE